MKSTQNYTYIYMYILLSRYVEKKSQMNQNEKNNVQITSMWAGFRPLGVERVTHFFT